MPCCLLVALILFTPRVVLVLMFLFSTFLERAYHGLLLPILGFFFLPLTTIVYAWLVNSHFPLDGVYLIILIVAVSGLFVHPLGALLFVGFVAVLLRAALARRQKPPYSVGRTGNQIRQNTGSEVAVNASTAAERSQATGNVY